MEGLTEEFERIDFHHPFTPYNVQEQFMRTVYDVLERGDGQIGILESPTGTVSNSISFHHNDDLFFSQDSRANRFLSSALP